MQCPRCGGQAYISDEDVVKIVESTDPVKIVIKVTYVCKSCSERFSKIVVENLERKKTEQEIQQTQPELSNVVEKAKMMARKDIDRLRILDI